MPDPVRLRSGRAEAAPRPGGSVRWRTLNRRFLSKGVILRSNLSIVFQMGFSIALVAPVIALTYPSRGGASPLRETVPRTSNQVPDWLTGWTADVRTIPQIQLNPLFDRMFRMYRNRETASM